MKRTIVVFIAALTSSTAFAESEVPQVEITQIFPAIQEILNLGDVGSIPEHDFFDRRVSGDGTPGDWTQGGVNASNLLVSTQPVIDHATQRMTGEQIIGNFINNSVTSLGAVDQSGMNVTNFISGETINTAVQFLGADALQSIENTYSTSAQTESIHQSGMNSANIAIAKHAIGTGEQDFVTGAQQLINNTIDLTMAVGGLTANTIEQEGVNIGNVMIAHRVDLIERTFAGDQIINNVVHLNSAATPGSIHQTGVNIANYVSADIIGTIHQTSYGSQVINNHVYDENGVEISQDLIDSGILTQEATFSMGNLTLLKSGAESSKESVVTQDADYEQVYNGPGGGHTQVGNMIVISQ